MGMTRYNLVMLPVRKPYYDLVRRLPGPDMAARQQGYGIELSTGQEQQLLMQCLCYGLEEAGSPAEWVSRQEATQIRMLAGRAIDRELSLAAYIERVGPGEENGVEFGFSMKILSSSSHYYW